MIRVRNCLQAFKTVAQDLERLPLIAGNLSRNLRPQCESFCGLMLKQSQTYQFQTSAPTLATLTRGQCTKFPLTQTLKNQSGARSLAANFTAFSVEQPGFSKMFQRGLTSKKSTEALQTI